MSRWIDNFKNHPFQSTWSQIKIQSESLVANDETIVTYVEEIARLKKVIAFLDELLEVVDAEMVPMSLWNQFYEQANACLNQINNYLSNKNIGHINTANEHLDNLLSYLKPYVVHSKGAAVAAGRAYNAYADAVNNQLGSIERRVNSLIKKIEDNKSETDNVVKEINASKANIEKLESSFLESEEGSPSLKDRMEGLFSDATAWYTKIRDFHQKLTSGNEQESAIILQIEEAKKKAFSDKKDVIEAKESIAELLADLGKFYVTIFGKEAESGEREGGLRQELDNRLSQLSDFEQQHQATYQALKKEIETLLPGAISAGLSSAYRDLKISFDDTIETYTKVFYGALAGIIFFGLILITEEIHIWPPSIKFVTIGDAFVLINNAIYKLPIFGTLIWLAYFASKRRSEDRRLQQEYAHKEALAKSYESFKKQIDALQPNDQELLKKLLDTAINAVSFNASQTLDGKHGDKMPILDISEKSINKAVGGIEKIYEIIKAIKG